MLELLRKRREDEDRGFTLIELMVVVLIIAILIAIAIPTFLGARKRAQDRAVQSNLRNALTAEKTWYTDAQAYTAQTDTTSGLGTIEPSLTFVTSSPTQGSKEVMLQVANVTGTDSGIVCLTAVSASGATFGLKDIATGSAAGTYFYKGAPTCDNTAGPAAW
jgi:type IV pilus assembly protein PilA